MESYIKRCRKELFGDSAISLTDMVAFCKDHSHVPDNLDTAFILAYEHSPLNEDEPDSDEDECFDDDDDDEQAKGPWFRFIATTKRLLMNSAHSEIMHADATYKIVIQRYPILNFGTTDKDNVQHFHLMGMMLSQYERTADYEFAFKASRDGVKRIIGTECKPHLLMSDAAPAIGNAFKSTFGDDVAVLMCFTHVLMNVDRKSFVHKDSKVEVKADIRNLRLAPNKTEIDIGCKLFLEKWSDISAP